MGAYEWMEGVIEERRNGFQVCCGFSMRCTASSLAPKSLYRGKNEEKNIERDGVEGRL